MAKGLPFILLLSPAINILKKFLEPKMLHGTKNFYFFSKLLQPDSANSQSQFLDVENSAWKHVCIQIMIFWLGRSKQMLQKFHWMRKSIKYLVPITINSCSAQAALNWLVLSGKFKQCSFPGWISKRWVAKQADKFKPSWPSFSII